MMSTVFVSSCRVDEPYVAALIDRLRESHVEVLHSPRNPSDSSDERWQYRYEHGCDSELDKAQVFVSVVTPGWEYSTWMQHELLAARRLLASGRISGMYHYNPAGIEVSAQDAEKSFGENLPAGLESAAQVLIDAVCLSNRGGEI